MPSLSLSLSLTWAGVGLAIRKCRDFCASDTRQRGNAYAKSQQSDWKP